VAAELRSAGHIFFSIAPELLHHRIDTFHHSPNFCRVSTSTASRMTVA